MLKMLAELLDLPTQAGITTQEAVLEAFDVRIPDVALLHATVWAAHVVDACAFGATAGATAGTMWLALAPVLSLAPQVSIPQQVLKQLKTDALTSAECGVGLYIQCHLIMPLTRLYVPGKTCCGLPLWFVRQHYDACWPEYTQRSSGGGVGGSWTKCGAPRTGPPQVYQPGTWSANVGL